MSGKPSDEIYSDKTEVIAATRKKIKKKINHSKLGSDFVPPEFGSNNSGWGWFICVAAGCSNLSTFPVLQQFGLLFRDRLAALEIPSAEVTTIINMNQSATALIGLANGPVFRRFTFRQVAIFGSILVSFALICTSFANSFITLLITFSILYGAGVGLCTSANSLALNTYFKEKRRIVTGISWSCTALGPVVFPLIITYLMPRYGSTGTVLILAGISMNAICCALLLQPVMWHVKKDNKSDEEKLLEIVAEIECDYCQSLKKKERKLGSSIFSSQYLYNVDDKFIAGYEIIDPGTPMLARYNDGWFSSSSAKRSLYSSKLSLTPKKYDSKKASTPNLAISNRPSYANLASASEKREKRAKEIRVEEKIDEHPIDDEKPGVSQEQELPYHKIPSVGSFRHYKTSPATPMASRNSFVLPQISENQYIRDNHSIRSYARHASISKRKNNSFTQEQEVLDQAKNKLEAYVSLVNERAAHCACEVKRLQFMNEQRNKKTIEEEDDELEENFTFLEKLIIFFDLNLLKDFSYINIMIGITIANFAELNFSILTPFVLSDFGLEKSQIAFCMSLLGGADIICRLLVPFVSTYTSLNKLENRTLFLIGVCNMALGRVFLAHFNSYYTALIIFLWIGFNKGLRTVFMALCIPSHVPLDRLPAATGIHLLFSGLFYIFMGPIVGIVRDHTTVVGTLHCLNITTYLCAISWILEKIILNRREKQMKNIIEESNDNEFQ